MRVTTFSRVFASALAIAAIAASAASAHIPHELGLSTTADSVVRPNPDQQTSSGTPAIQRSSEAAQVAAHNRAEALKQRALAYSLPRTAPYSVANAADVASSRPVAGTAPTVPTSSDGFDYGDAAIGAAIVAAIAVLITAGALGLDRRSQPRHS